MIYWWKKILFGASLRYDLTDTAWVLENMVLGMFHGLDDCPPLNIKAMRAISVKSYLKCLSIKHSSIRGISLDMFIAARADL